MKILIILIGSLIIWLIWKYLLSDKTKDALKGCLLALAVLLVVMLEVADLVTMCSQDNDEYYTRDPYDDARK